MTIHIDADIDTLEERYVVECDVCGRKRYTVDADGMTRDRVMRLARTKGWRISIGNGARCPVCVGAGKAVA